MTTGTFPRQPREFEPANQARVVTHPRYFGVECIQTDSTWFEVAQFEGGADARAMRDRLNALFGHPGADLDFLHITRFGSGPYAVVWPTVKWVVDGSVTTDIGGACTGGAGGYTTQENLYKPSPLFTIAEVTAADVKHYGKPPHKVAFQWANAIRYAVNGWNSTKDVIDPPLYNGVIPVLPTPTDWHFATVTRDGTYYGYGECQPNFTMANNEIFHTMDLVIAVPMSSAGQARWARNQWVKITYGRRSCHARLTDVCGCEHLDLSRGLATYLRFPGSGRVTVSKP